MDTNQDQSNEINIQNNSNQKQKRIIGASIAVFLVIGLCLCVILGIIAWKFDLIGLIFGGDKAASAMPDDIDFYIGFNLLNATPEKLNRVIQPFTDILQEQGQDVSDADDALKEIDKSLAEQIGLTVTDDILPWVGQYAGVGITRISLDSSDSPNFLGAVQIRDSKAADKFIRDFRHGLVRNGDIDFSEKEYKGINITIVEDYTNLVFCRSKSLFLISDNIDTIKDSIDMQAGDSLAQNKLFKDVTKKLPKIRFVTIYLNGDVMSNFIDQISDSMGGYTNITDIQKGINALAFSISVTDPGLEFDTVTSYDLDDITETQKEFLNLKNQDITAFSMLPEKTFFFMGGQHIDLTWEILKVSLIGSGSEEDFNAAMESLQTQIGVNPDTDILPYIDGDYSLGVFPSNDGLISYLDIGMLGLFETSDSEKVNSSIKTIIKSTETDSLLISEDKVGNINTYTMGDSETAEITIGLSKNYLGFGTEKRMVIDALDNKNSFLNSRRYKEMMSSIPNGYFPILYIDVSGIIDVIKNMDDDEFADEYLFYIKPVKYLVLSGSSLNGNLVRNSLLIAIEEVE